MQSTSLFTEAYKYCLVWDFSIIPLKKDKRPYLLSWREYQKRKPTEAEITDWWTRWPDANIGIVTGEISQLTVIDIDLYKSEATYDFPKTYTVRTGNGGLHLYYKHAPGFTISANGYPQYPNVDMRSDGGYVVAPPSVTSYEKDGKQVGGEYTVLHAIDFAPFPVHLFPEQKKKRKLSTLTNVPSGQRSDSITSFIGKLLYSTDADAWSTQVWPVVVSVNKTYSPPLPEDELRTTFESIATKERTRRETSIPSPIQISATERIDITLRRNSNGVPYRDMTNALSVLNQHPATKGTIRYNIFRGEIEFRGQPIEEADYLGMVVFLQGELGLANISKDTVASAINYYAYQNRYDEAIDWLKTLKWDGTPRIHDWLTRVAKIVDDPERYHRTVGANWLYGMVLRLARPGVVFDNALVLVGPQGVGKTSLFRILGGPWYKSFTGSMDNKDFYMLLRGACVVDLDEGATLSRSDSIKIKSILTQTFDEYRPPYGHVMQKVPRRFVFSMSTNDLTPFRDMTGNRRYWPVRVEDRVDFEWLTIHRDQLFAEAYHMITHDEKPEPVPEAEALSQQEEYVETDEWAKLIVDHIVKSKAYCTGDPNYNISIIDIYKDVLKGDRLDQLERRHMMRIGNILRKELGLEKTRRRVDGKLQYCYYLSPKKAAELRNNPITGTYETTLDDF